MIFPAVVGPVFEAHALTLPVPEIVQLSVPVGAVALVAPVSVAVNVIEPPRTAEPDGEITRVGVATETTVDVDETTPDTALYAPPCAMLNVAEYVPVFGAEKLQV